MVPVLFIVWSIFFGFSRRLSRWFGYNTLGIIIHCLCFCAFTNAIFIDAERDGHKWLKEWKEEQNRYTIITNRLVKSKNFKVWNPKEHWNDDV